jgi:hypothetical protein
MGACLFVADLASTALAGGWPGASGLGVAAAGYSSRLRAGDLVPTALAAGWLGASRASGGVVKKQWRLLKA